MADFTRVPSKMSLFAIKQQGLGILGKGTAVSLDANTNIWPLGERAGLAATLNVEPVRVADGRAHDGIFVDRGEWYEGDVTIPIYPGYIDGDDGLEDLMLTRDSSWQGMWFSCWVDLGANYRRKFTDCKVRSFRMTIEAGREPTVALTISGLGRETGEDIDATATDVVDSQPYQCKEIAVQAASFGGELATITTLKSIELSGDNCLPDMESEIRLASSCNPQDLPNFAGLRLTGTLNAEFSDSDFIDAFEAGTLYQIKVTLTRAGVATATITLPRIKFTAHPLMGGGGEGFVEQDGISFLALGSGSDYATAPMTMTEAVS